MAYSVEEIHAFGSRLQINTFLGIFFNSLASFIILKYSTSSMKNYKYYILSTVIFAFLMDFHVTFIFGMFPLFLKNDVMYAGCPTGISRHLGSYWGGTIQIGIFHFTLSFCGLSVFFGLIYQYFSLTKNKHFLKTIPGVICVGLFMLIYPLPSFILYLHDYSDSEFFNYLKINNPELIEFFIAASCVGQIFTKSATIYLIVCSLQILLVPITAIIIIIKMVKKLSEKKNQMSSKTLKMQQQYFRALIIQFFLPVIFMLFPLTFFLTMIFFNVNNHDTYIKICIHVISLHSVANSLTILFVIKSYRQVFTPCFDTLFQICKKKWINSKRNVVF